MAEISKLSMLTLGYNSFPVYEMLKNDLLWFCSHPDFGLVSALPLAICMTWGYLFGLLELIFLFWKVTEMITYNSRGHKDEKVTMFIKCLAQKGAQWKLADINIENSFMSHPQARFSSLDCFKHSCTILLWAMKWTKNSWFLQLHSWILGQKIGVVYKMVFA